MNMLTWVILRCVGLLLSVKLHLMLFRWALNRRLARAMTTPATALKAQDLARVWLADLPSSYPLQDNSGPSKPSDS